MLIYVDIALYYTHSLSVFIYIYMYNKYIHTHKDTYIIYIYCETPSVLTKVPCSSHDMDAHPFLCAVSGLTKGWAVVRDLSHRGKGIGCLCGDLVGEDAINIGSGAAW